VADCGSWTIQVTTGATTHDVLQLAFELDGTYSVSLPRVHVGSEATIFKALSVTGLPRKLIIEETVRKVSIADDETQVTLRHHPDGTLRFCSAIPDITDEDYRIDGVPASDEINGPVPPPTLQCVVGSVSDLRISDGSSSSTYIIRDELIAPSSGEECHLIEVALFSVDYRELLVKEGDDWFLRIVRGDSGILRLPALLASSQCDRQDFVALRIRRMKKPKQEDFVFSMTGFGQKQSQDDRETAMQLCAVSPTLSTGDLPKLGQRSPQPHRE
jgi:hypothetical protein